MKFLSNLIYRAKYKYGKYLNLKAPVDVTLELSSNCNQKCAYCYHSDDILKFPKGEMSLITARRILDQAHDMKVPAIKLNWRGESHLNKCFPEIAAYAKELNFLDRISNSNFNFNPCYEMFGAFANQTTLKISFDSFRKEVFDKQRQGSNFERILRNIDSYYYKYMPKNQTVIIQMVRTNLNAYENLEEEAKKRWPKCKVSIRNCVSNRADGAKNLGKELLKERVPCYQAYARLIFDHTGSATTCCPDIHQKFNFGNIWYQDLKDIWNDSDLKRLRIDLFTGKAFDSDPCKNCSSLESYEDYKHTWNS